MWQYIKGILYGLFLLWLLLFVCLAIPNGIFPALWYAGAVAAAVFKLLQAVTHGTGIWIVLFVILSSWIWSLGRGGSPRAIASGHVPVGASLMADAQPPVTTEAGLGSEQK